MDDIQEKHERAVGDCFITWYNQQYKTCFSFKSRADKAPDLIYSDGKNNLKLEIVDAYYDEKDAQMKWMNARKIPNAPNSWSGVNFDEKLVQRITEVLISKCKKSYGSNCILVVNVSPSLTTAEELESLITDISVLIHTFLLTYFLLAIFLLPVIVKVVSDAGIYPSQIRLKFIDRQTITRMTDTIRRTGVCPQILSYFEKPSTHRNIEKLPKLYDYSPRF